MSWINRSVGILFKELVLRTTSAQGAVRDAPNWWYGSSISRRAGEPALDCSQRVNQSDGFKRTVPSSQFDLLEHPHLCQASDCQVGGLEAAAGESGGSGDSQYGCRRQGAQK